MPLGSIVIDLLLKTGAFETDTARAAKRIRDLKRDTNDFATSLKASFAGNLLAGAVEGIVSELRRVPAAIVDITREAGNFKDVEERIGAAAEDFAGFSVAAATAGLSMQSLEGFSVRLTKALSKIDDESEGAGKALAALGIPVEEFKKLDPVKQIERLSSALAAFKDGPGKTAVLEALTKGGSEALSFLKALEEQGGRQNILTREQILLADDLADRQARATAELKAFLQQGLIAALPAITAFTQGIGDMVKSLLGVDDAAKNLARQNAVRDFADNSAVFLARLVDFARLVGKAFEYLGETIAATAAIAAALADQSGRGAKAAFSFDPKGLLDVVRGQTAQINEITKAARERGKALADFESFAEQVQKRINSRHLTGQRGNAFTDPRSTTFGQTAPEVDTRGLSADKGTKKSDESAKIAKRELDEQLKVIERELARERDLFQQRNTFLNLFNSQGIVSIRDYYDAQRNIIEDNTEAQAILLNEQIAALEKAQSRLKPDEQIANQSRINDLRAQGARIAQEASAKQIELSIRQAADEKRFADQVVGLNAEVLELRGNLAEAAGIKFDLSNAELINRARAEGNEQAKANLQILRQNSVAQAEFNQHVKTGAEITEALRVQEERISVSRQLGATTELESLQRLGQERQKALVQLEAEVKAREAIARANPESKTLSDQAARARAELEQLSAVADPLGDKFRSIFKDSLASPLEEFINGTKSAKEAFNDFVSNVLAGFARIAAQGIAEQLFAKGSGGGDWASTLGQLFAGAFGGSRAYGGDVIAGRDYWVGEDGPERFRPRVNGTIVPNERTTGRQGASGVTSIVNVNFKGEPDRRSTYQVANEISREQRMALRLN